MKKVLLVIVILLALAVAGLAIVILTFDADRYRPLLVSTLEKAIGRPVQLERLSLGWQQGIALQVRGLTIAEGAQAAGEPLLHVESTSAFVELMPLLRKDVRVTSVVLKQPRIHLIRDAQGNLNLVGLAVAASPAAAPGQAATAGGAGVSFNVASLRIEDGTLHWTDAMTHPPTDLWMKSVNASITNISLETPMDIEIAGALAGETPNLRLRGRFTPPSATAQGALEQAQLAIENLSLDDVLPPSGPQEPRLQGQLTVNLQGGLTTLDPAQLSRSLAGSGRFKIAEPVLANLNILREVFAQFSVIPGLMEKLQERLPPEYQAKLSATDTVFSPMDLSMRVESGAVRFDNVSVSTEDFRLIGSGWVGLNGAVTIRSLLRIEPVLSQALIQSVNELRYLATKDGEVEIPLAIQGQASRLAVAPDLNYIASKLLVPKAQDLLGNFLQKAFEKNAPSDAPAPPAEASP